ncbi:MAG: DUF7683 domain-containing protein [Microcystaceae cyanobacterium]
MVVKATQQELSSNSESQQPVERWVRWFRRDGDEFVGEAQLVGVALSQLKQVFTPFPDDPLMYYCYPVETAKQVEFLSLWLNGELDLEAYEYFVECNASF